MKSFVQFVLAAAASLSAAAQTPDITSTVVEKKLNFEAPLFGVTVKNVKPTWSLVAFGEVNLGCSYAFRVPEYVYTEVGTVPATGEMVEMGSCQTGLHAAGSYVALSLLELRYRPWRDGNLFFWGLDAVRESHWLHRGALFNKYNEPARVAIGTGRTGNCLGIYSERVLSLDIGYVRETGDWSFGFRLLPGIGYSQYRNIYNPAGPSHLKVTEDVVLRTGGKYYHCRDITNGPLGLRFSAVADVWYRNFGGFVSVRPGHTGYNGGGPEYTTVSAGLSIRY